MTEQAQYNIIVDVQNQEAIDSLNRLSNSFEGVTSDADKATDAINKNERASKSNSSASKSLEGSFKNLKSTIGNLVGAYLSLETAKKAIELVTRGVSASVEAYIATSAEAQTQQDLLAETFLNLKQTMGEALIGGNNFNSMTGSLTGAIGILTDFIDQNRDSIQSVSRDGFGLLLRVIPSVIRGLALTVNVVNAARLGFISLQAGFDVLAVSAITTGTALIEGLVRTLQLVMSTATSFIQLVSRAAGAVGLDGLAGSLDSAAGFLSNVTDRTDEAGDALRAMTTTMAGGLARDLEGYAQRSSEIANQMVEIEDGADQLTTSFEGLSQAYDSGSSSAERYARSARQAIDTNSSAARDTEGILDAVTGSIERLWTDLGRVGSATSNWFTRFSNEGAIALRTAAVEELNQSLESLRSQYESGTISGEEFGESARQLYEQFEDSRIGLKPLDSQGQLDAMLQNTQENLREIERIEDESRRRREEEEKEAMERAIKAREEQLNRIADIAGDVGSFAGNFMAQGFESALAGKDFGKVALKLFGDYLASKGQAMLTEGAVDVAVGAFGNPVQAARGAAELAGGAALVGAGKAIGGAAKGGGGRRAAAAPAATTQPVQNTVINQVSFGFVGDRRAAARDVATVTEQSLRLGYSN